jgi:hypothetical protein
MLCAVRPSATELVLAVVKHDLLSSRFPLFKLGQYLPKGCPSRDLDITSNRGNCRSYVIGKNMCLDLVQNRVAVAGSVGDRRHYRFALSKLHLGLGLTSWA